MRLLARLCALSTAGLLGLGTVLVGGVAAAAPVPTLSGSAPAAAHGPATVTFTYLITLPAAVDATVFSTRQDAAVPASATGVTLDGAAVPAGQISRPSTIDIAVQTGPTPADGLAAGTHTLTFTSAIGSSMSADTSSTATLSWTSAGVPGSVTSAPVTVAVNAPDVAVALTPDTGEDQVGFLGTGEDLTFAVDVANLGYGSPHTTMHVTLPAGMTLGPDGVTRDSDGTPVSCTTDPSDAQQVSCPLGVLVAGGGDPTLDLDLTTEPGEPIGTVGTVTVSAAPDAGEGTDSDPSNNSVTAQVEYTGSARLSYTVTPAAAKVPLGGQTTVRLTVHNAGPQPAPSAIAFGVVVGKQFEITGFTGQTDPPASMQKAPLNTSRLGPIVHTDANGGAVDPISGSGGSAVLWFVGDIPAGSSVSATLTIKAHALGTAQVGILAVSGAADPNCPNFDCDPTTANVTAVAVPATPAPSERPADSSGTPIAGAAQLANTGASRTPAVLGLALLVAGCGLLALGHRRTKA